MAALSKKWVICVLAMLIINQVLFVNIANAQSAEAPAPTDSDDGETPTEAPSQEDRFLVGKPLFRTKSGAIENQV